MNYRYIEDDFVRSLYRRDDDLFKRLGELKDEIREIDTCIALLEKYGIEDGDGGVTCRLNAKRDEIGMMIDDVMQERCLVIDRIRSCQNSCTHDFVDDGYDSHHDYYVCRKCGYELTC